MATRNDWQELVSAVRELGQAFGFEVRFWLRFGSDVMCCKVAGNTVEITRKELEERKFGKLYDAMKTAMERAGIEQPERFLVKAPPYPETTTATEIAMQMEFERQQLEQQLALTRRVINDNQYKDEMPISLASIGNELLPGLVAVRGDGSVRYLPLAREREQEGEAEPEQPATWREPRETPELELGEPSEISKLDVLMQASPSEPAAPDLILEPEQDDQHGTGKKVAS